MMLREPITIQKSRSCPADFSSDDIDRSSKIPQASTPPASNGTSNRRKSDSKKTPGLNGNGTTTYTVTMTAPSSNGMTRSSAEKALPGRPRRRGGNRTTMTVTKRKKNPSQSIRYRLMNARWMKNPMQSSNTFYSLAVAVLLWYTLGVISITSSNLLMMEPRDYVGGVPPLFLTFQQLVIGTTLLRGLLHIRFLGSPGIQPWPSPSAAAQAAESRRKNLLFNNLDASKNSALR